MSSVGQLRRMVDARDHGVCAQCHLDTAELLSRLRAQKPKRRTETILAVAPHWGATQQTRAAAARLAQHVQAGVCIPDWIETQQVGPGPRVV